MSKVKLICEDGIVASALQKIPGITVVSAEMETAELQAVQTKYNEVTASYNTAQAKIMELEGIVAANATALQDSESKVTELEAAVLSEKTTLASVQTQLAGFTKPVTAPVAIPVAAVIPVIEGAIAETKVGYVKNPSVEKKNVQYV